MPLDVTVTSDEMQRRLLEIRDRCNEQITMLNALPNELRATMNMQVYDDIEFLFRYITALHGVLDEVTTEESRTFDF